ncbi:hypothetical protein [Microcoleus sp. herbarium12]|uniref:hypothetical protein n=1 Tax=Microcoleus sp. herbarium12 TaxID=3055437 RepID=UPI002FD75D14
MRFEIEKLGISQDDRAFLLALSDRLFSLCLFQKPESLCLLGTGRSPLSLKIAISGKILL